METPEEFLKHYHNDLPNDWLYEKRNVVARLIKEYTEKALSQPAVMGQSEVLKTFAKHYNDVHYEIISEDFIDEYTEKALRQPAVMANFVMANFLEMKAKEHKCKPSELNIGYYEGEAFLYKTYYDKYYQIKVAWEQDLKTGEITHNEGGYF